uniref:DUF1064 domain-containing protein n=1 Tax=viral metagenome TaxID=1070528 RepID=A0A6M3IEZ2_9ZZZZ
MNYKNTKQGKRADLGNVFFRSGWEANYARYLEWRKKNGDIAEWDYEVDEFQFPVKRGTRFYLTDFKVTLIDGSVEYHEVKGFMTQKANTALKRMAKYYPDIKIELIDGKRYAAIVRQVGKIIKSWE